MAYGAKDKEAKPKRKSEGKLSDDEVLSIVNGEFDNAMSKEGGEISTERARAWDAYLAKPLGNEIPGNSQIVTTDVSDVIDGIMPSLLRIFCSEENLAKFQPVGEEDIKAAQDETDAVHHVFFHENPSFLITHTWFMDALAQKNGIVKAWWDESEEVSTENYSGLLEEELAVLNDDEELEPVEQNERKEMLMLPTPTPLGVMPMEREVTVYDVSYKRTTTRGRICVMNIPPEEYRISSDANNPDPAQARMVGHEREVTRSDAIAMGHDKEIIMGLPSSTMSQTQEEKRSRKKAEEQDTGNVSDPSMEKILYREAYIKMDYDKDGIAELRHVCIAGDELLENEECDRQPFHVLTPKPMPHKHFGRSVGEQVMDIQKINTTLLRQALDNLYHTNQPGHAVWEQAMGEDTLEDLLTTQTGRVARFTRPPGEAWAPMSIPFTAQHSFAAIEYFDKAKRQRTGISDDGEGLTPDALKHIQQSVMSQAIDVARGKIEAIARVFAETGFKSLLLHIHEMLIKHQDKEKQIEVRGNFITMKPTEWRDRKDMVVTVGLGIGTREQNLLHLSSIWGMQKDIVANGGLGTLIQPKQIYNTGAQVVRNANLRHPEMYFVDPGDQAIPPPGSEKDPQAEAAAAMVEVERERNQLKAQEQQMKHQGEMLQMQQKITDMQANHMMEVARIQQQNDKIQNDFTIAMENIKNQLTDMELKYATNVPGSAV